ncbi:TraB/VirB10 family protein [Desulfopila aestuarii]|uniref:Conjugal transfer pilus assembly protein TraB n=1 Tax=Desulfopila aestuarii DSM 18488 TaxID=1121416 RepID=A0A1M7YHN8_9BACT|nr:TraB/VirB10 family protein [Desulfopila aestuarii]SHO52059.1 conjugal transfer pilus assembly protein TraB [Desulfopila aestuarii DSM 18488]
MKHFDKLEPRQKKQVVWAVIGIILFILIMAGYNLRSQRTLELAGQPNVKAVELEPDLIEKTMLREARRELESLRVEIEKLKNEQELHKRKQPEKAEQSILPSADEIAKSPPPATVAEKTKWPMPMGEEVAPRARARTVPPAAIPDPEPLVIGEIEVLSNPEAEVIEEPKKKGRAVYLPPSFMEASLLTGFDASTSRKGKGDPEPMLLRIQTPAVLPNDVKGDVEGCFVVAEAVGRLDKERADVRLVSLSCLSKNGQAVIDEQVKGFVTDSDSKVGLSGRVVSRMGAATARAVVAGLFGGAGDWLKAASTTTSVSALGSTQTVESGDIVPYAVGGGLAEGADTLRDFYVDLVKQTTPVIEVGATKKITVVISEGKELVIREIDSGTI